VATAGDVNGDGYDDVLIAARQFDSPLTDEGRVVVVANAGATVVKTVLGTLPDSQFGFCLAGGRGFEGDNTSDIVVGSPLMRINGANSGACILYSTSDVP